MFNFHTWNCIYLLLIYWRDFSFSFALSINLTVCLPFHRRVISPSASVYCCDISCVLCCCCCCCYSILSVSLVCVMCLTLCMCNVSLLYCSKVHCRICMAKRYFAWIKCHRVHIQNTYELTVMWRWNVNACIQSKMDGSNDNTNETMANVDLVHFPHIDAKIFHSSSSPSPSILLLSLFMLFALHHGNASLECKHYGSLFLSCVWCECKNGLFCRCYW